MSVTLKSNDGQTFSLSKEAADKFLTVSKQKDLEEIKGDVLKLVVDYLEHYKNTEQPKIPEVLKSNNLKNEIDDWDYNFINPITFEQAFHLINAGVLLEIEHLHDLSCAKIAAFMKNKSPEEVNKEFTIECQLTQEEAKELGLDAN